MATRQSLPFSAYRAAFDPQFDSRVDRSGVCWIWTGALTSRGYGHLYAGKTVRAHRFAFERAHGPLGAGVVVCHRCDNRLCVRPDHLFAGSLSDNMRDMVAKGRQRKSRLAFSDRCSAGHSLMGRLGVSGGQFYCRECKRLRAAARYHRVRA